MSGGPRQGRTARNPYRTSRVWQALAYGPVGGWVTVIAVVLLIGADWPRAGWWWVHMATLGIITSSIVVFTDYFASALLKSRPTTMGTLAGRLALVHGALLVAGAALSVGIDAAVWGAVAAVVALAGWHTLALWRQIRLSLAPRFAGTIWLYVAAFGFLVVGVGVAGLMVSQVTGLPMGQLIAAHVIATVGGFVYVVIASTWLTFWPMALRVQIPPGSDRAVIIAGVVLCAGIAAMIPAAVWDLVALGAVGFVTALAGVAMLTGVYLRMALRRAPREFSTLSLGTAWVWGIVGLSVAGYSWVASGMLPPWLTPVWVLGFGVQMVMGALAYLIPALKGGGPANARRNNHTTNLAMRTRWVAWNAAVVLLGLGALGPMPGVLFALCAAVFVAIGLAVVLRAPLTREESTAASPGH